MVNEASHTGSIEGKGEQSHWSWLSTCKSIAVPVACFLVYEAILRSLVKFPDDADWSLAFFSLGLAALILVWTVAKRQFEQAGWRTPQGLSSLWVAGPLWLGVISPLAIAISFFGEHPEKVLPLAMTSVLVAFNEETLFRGFMLGGLRRSLAAVPAAFLSSLAFGAMHYLNLLEGADFTFVTGQACAAAGVGLIMSAMTIRSESIVPAMLFHTAMDFVGLGALEGYDNAMQQSQLATQMVVTGVLFGAWGLFWCWRIDRRDARQGVTTETDVSNLTSASAQH